MKLSKSRKITLAAFFLTLGLILPFFTGQIPTIGSQLLPMHIPILLCGFILGGGYGALVGFITPLLRSMLFGMPPILTATTMAFELAAYGFFTGFLYRKLEKNTINIYLTLIVSMLLGRIIWGIISCMIYGIGTKGFGFAAFITGGFTNAIPGIVLQVIIIPLLVISLKKGNHLYEE